MTKSSSPRKIKLDAALCRHAYEDATVAMARLAAYSTSRSLKVFGHGEYYSISPELCKKDLLILAISTRRLAELTKSQSILQDKKIEFLSTEKSPAPQSISCWKIIGNIIHSIDMDILKDVGMALYAFTDVLKAIESVEEVDAVAIIKSDKYPPRTIKINDIILRLNDYMEEVNDILSDNGIYLGSLYE